MKKFRKDQVWLTRDGRPKVIDYICPGCNARFPVSTADGLSYTLRGKYNIRADRVSALDLVECVYDPVHPPKDVAIEGAIVGVNSSRVHIREEDYPKQFVFSHEGVKQVIEALKAIDKYLDKVVE